MRKNVMKIMALVILFALLIGSVAIGQAQDGQAPVQKRGKLILVRLFLQKLH